ncbi:hypothetical protein [Neorhodopirellula pilleata]|uniref:Uncharacterized protein n=1 Tax=Neorhodopirellula pilleata TaxID=2714738 RepID=A0A5C6AXG9_9BACT|nr:hypothetical protein [Neorhodopirellula pilleata]TWU03859.1 hypothetical protein Pla100_07940 [Neorhodopirellula pilleata]
MDQTTHSATNASSSATFAPDDKSQEHRHQGTEHARRTASHAAESVKQQASATEEELKRQATEVADAAKQKACEAAEQAKRSGVQYAHQKKTRMAEEIGVFSNAIRKASHKLHEEQHDSIASYVDVAAEQLDRCRQSLESKDVSELMDDVQDFARRRPEIVYGGMFVAGLAAMRFLKASKPPRSNHPRQDLSLDRNRPPAAFGHHPDTVVESAQSLDTPAPATDPAITTDVVASLDPVKARANSALHTKGGIQS